MENLVWQMFCLEETKIIKIIWALIALRFKQKGFRRLPLSSFLIKYSCLCFLSKEISWIRGNLVWQTFNCTCLCSHRMTLFEPRRNLSILFISTLDWFKVGNSKSNERETLDVCAEAGYYLGIGEILLHCYLVN